MKRGEPDGHGQRRETTRVLMQIPITPAERRTLKHRAIDEGATLGEIVRKALGFPPVVDTTQEAATM